ncbi:hypothetical protein [Streptomyces zhihengii]|uniref:WXG100 family type VII secretion target n=1 Tax=Streptomyces zhihengii TaxID=1818004 RepID=A0ABS2V5A3_9ACTN|nr:hypothetical protein [Streptomyces zhihengii]MBM9624498.1 hypothetical protein [Streptomyces zhihengii]
MAATGRQTFDFQKTQQGISALSDGAGDVRRGRTSVEEVKSVLLPGYQGADGAEFGRLLNDWLTQCEVVARKLDEMQATLEETLRSKTGNQQAAQEMITQARNNSGANAIFSRLAP